VPELKVKNGIVWARIGATVLAVTAVLMVAQKIDGASNGWRSSYREQSLNMRYRAVTGTHNTAATQDLYVRHNTERVLKVGAMPTPWVLRDSRVSYVAGDIYSLESDLTSVRDPPNPAMRRTSLRNPIGVDGGSDVAASEAENANVVSPNVAQSEGLDATGAFEMDKTFADEVQRRLTVPPADQLLYGSRLEQALQAKSLGATANEYVVLVDRNQNVQALFIYFRAKVDDTWHMVGATPVSTGLPGTYDHFTTPLGVFEHTPRNMDFRSEGTLNEFKIRGYGARDMRIYDFGWAQGERGWGKGGMSQMRFQMHATDPNKLEPVLGIRHSKGCVRIPAALNVFFDHHGILDADYEARVAAGESLWILKPRRDPTPWAGHYLVVIDSARNVRPAWSSLPDGKARSQFPAHGDSAD
jgi:hypothetical protein